MRIPRARRSQRALSPREPCPHEPRTTAPQAAVAAPASDPPLSEPKQPVVAIVPWGLAIEDFLTPNGLSLDEFCGEFTGSWIFGVVESLRAAGADAVIICVSTGVAEVTRRRHEATGAAISLLPLPRTARAYRSYVHPYARGERSLVGTILSPALLAAREATPYLSTPVRALRHELRAYGCHALLCQEYEFPRFDLCVGLGRLMRLPTFAIFQGGDYRRWRTESLARPVAMRLASGFVIASRAEADRVQRTYGVPASKIAAIPNPIDERVWAPGDRMLAREELGIASDAAVAAWHGRVELRKKGLDVLVDAWADLTARLEEQSVLLLIGSGGDDEQLRALLQARGLSNVIWLNRLLHEPAAIARLLAAADVYVFPSRHEGFPLAPLEAMACGLPVVSAAVSGVRDVLADGERAGGILVPVEDAAALADALERVLSDPGRSRDLSRRARRRAEEFASAAVGKRLRDFLLAVDD